MQDARIGQGLTEKASVRLTVGMVHASCFLLIDAACVYSPRSYDNTKNSSKNLRLDNPVTMLGLIGIQDNV